jgi:hypothetical protein
VDFKHRHSNVHQNIQQTISIQQRPPCEADSYYSGQEISLLHGIQTGPYVILLRLRGIQGKNIVGGTVEHLLVLLSVCL